MPNSHNNVQTINTIFAYMDNEHKTYIKQLCENGRKNQSDNAEKIRKFKNFYLNFAYIANANFIRWLLRIFNIWNRFEFSQ